MFKSIHKDIYKERFVQYSYKTSREFIIRGYRKITSDPVDLLAHCNISDNTYFIKEGIYNELIRMYELIGYKY